MRTGCRDMRTEMVRLVCERAPAWSVEGSGANPLRCGEKHRRAPHGVGDNTQKDPRLTVPSVHLHLEAKVTLRSSSGKAAAVLA